jgi:hypothetical protein
MTCSGEENDFPSAPRSGGSAWECKQGYEGETS